MTDPYRIDQLDEPAWDPIGPGISQYNRAHTGRSDFQRLCFVLRDSDEGIVGGVIAELYYDWLHVDLLWVQEELRGQGHGSRLLVAAEEEARRQGATQAYLDTFSFQAPEFYYRQGYRVFGELDDFPPGHQRYFMAKEL